VSDREIRVGFLFRFPAASNSGGGRKKKRPSRSHSLWVGLALINFDVTTLKRFCRHHVRHQHSSIEEEGEKKIAVFVTKSEQGSNPAYGHYISG
jgi:hypothetical protein